MRKKLLSLLLSGMMIFQTISPVYAATETKIADTSSGVYAEKIELQNMQIDPSLIDGVWSSEDNVYGNSIQNVFDGVASKGWNIGGYEVAEYDTYGVFSLKSRGQLSKLKIHWAYFDRLKKLTVQQYIGTGIPTQDEYTTTDANKWETIGEQTDFTVSEINLKANKSRYYRLVAHFYYPSSFTAIHEIDIYGSIENSVNVTLADSKGGESKQFITTKGEYTLPVNPFVDDSHKAYIFTGWLVDNQLKQAGEKINVNGDVTITAQWKTNVAYGLTQAKKQIYTNVTDPEGIDKLFNSNFDSFFKLKVNEWVAFELQNPAIISELRLFGDNQFYPLPKAFSLQTLNDEAVFEAVKNTNTVSEYLNNDNNWHDILTVTNETELLKKSYSVPSVENSKVYRLKVNELNTGKGAYINELQMIQREAPQNPVTVTFKPGTGNGKSYTIQWEKNQSMPIPYCRFSKQDENGDMYFTGWKATGNGGATDETNYHVDVTKGTPNITVNGDLTLTAQWKGKEYVDIQFKPGDGGNGTMHSVNWEVGKTFTLPQCAFTHDSLYFTGWKVTTTENSNVVVKNPSEEVTVAKGMTVTAQWEGTKGIPSDNKTFTSGAYKIEDNFSERIEIKGTVTLILDGYGVRNISKGIHVPKGSTLTLKGPGTLFLQGEDYNSSIGGNWNEVEMGTVIFDNIEVSISQSGAGSGHLGCGIGLGDTNQNKVDCGGKIVFNGGDITVEKIGGNIVPIGNHWRNSPVDIEFVPGSTTTITTCSPISEAERSDWSGFVSEDGGTTTTVYGNQTTAAKTVEKDKNLVIDSNGSLTLQGDLTVAQGATLTVNGTLTVPQGMTLTNNGTIKGTGTIAGEGTFSDNSASTEGLVVEVPAKENLIYTGNAVTANQFKIQRTICNKTFDVSGWSTPVFTKGGKEVPTDWPTGDDYKIIYSKVGEANVTKEQTFTIFPAEINGTLKQDNELIYKNGEDLIPTASGLTAINNQKITLQYSIEQNGTYGTMPTFTEAGTYTVFYKATAPNHSEKTGSFTVTVKQSASEIIDLKAYKEQIQTNTFTYGDTITVKAKLTATGNVPVQKVGRMKSMFSLFRTAPVTNQMALFVGDTQISEAVVAGDDGYYVMTVNTTDSTVKEKLIPESGAIEVTAKFVGNTNMADTTGVIAITIQKSTYQNQILEVGNSYGVKSDVDLKNVLCDGAITGNILVKEDVNQILKKESLKIEQNILKCEIIKDVNKIGKQATIEIPITSKYYNDYTITVIVTVEDLIYTEKEEIAATCTKDGVKKHFECNDGNLYVEQNGKKVMVTKEDLVIPMIPHSFEDWKVVKESTTTEKGIEERVCSVCGKKETRELPLKPMPQPEPTPQPETPVTPVVQGEKVGTKVVDTKTKGKYKVSKSDEKTKEVQYTSPISKKLKTVKIPDTIVMKGITYKVTSIAKDAFKNNKYLQKVIIGKNIKKIDKKAFYGCKKLKSVMLGKELTVIEDDAFKNCTSLTKVTIPSKVTKIDQGVFYGCKKLKKIYVKSTKIKKVGKNAFKGIYKKATIKVPKSKYKKYKKTFAKKGQSSSVKITK